MATIRQPTVYDYASPSQFRIVLDKIPNVEWFVVSANVPGVNIGEALFPTPMVDLGIVGDKITYETLDVTFLVDEELINYRELHKWITDISFPFSSVPTKYVSFPLQEKVCNSCISFILFLVLVF